MSFNKFFLISFCFLSSLISTENNRDVKFNLVAFFSAFLFKRVHGYFAPINHNKNEKKDTIGIKIYNDLFFDDVMIRILGKLYKESVISLCKKYTDLKDQKINSNVNLFVDSLALSFNIDSFIYELKTNNIVMKNSNKFLVSFSLFLGVLKEVLYFLIEKKLEDKINSYELFKSKETISNFSKVMLFNILTKCFIDKAFCVFLSYFLFKKNTLIQDKKGKLQVKDDILLNELDQNRIDEEDFIKEENFTKNSFEENYNKIIDLGSAGTKSLISLVKTLNHFI